jgi:hypothetical protein
MRRLCHGMGLVLLLAGGACSESATPADGTCVSDSTVDCTVSGLAGDSIGLSGVSCTGSARPDENGKFLDGVPSGLICADRATGIDGARRYCCTSQTTTCAYDPVADCQDPKTVGYQCRGSDRPDALNPAINCSQGVPDGDLVNYCCAGQPHVRQCTEYGGCASGTTGWTCPAGYVPSAQDLGPNTSRADTYYFLCPVPTPAPNPAYVNYCCVIPAALPEGGSCVQHNAVPGCAAGRFGMACYDRDRPDQDYLSLSCPDAGFSGLSAEGYPATLYCCDLKK